MVVLWSAWVEVGLFAAYLKFQVEMVCILLVVRIV